MLGGVLEGGDEGERGFESVEGEESDFADDGQSLIHDEDSHRVTQLPQFLGPKALLTTTSYHVQ